MANYLTIWTKIDKIRKYFENGQPHACDTRTHETEWNSYRETARICPVKICSKFRGEHPCRNVIKVKLLCKFIEVTPRHWCSPVNLPHIFRTYFPKNTSKRLLPTNSDFKNQEEPLFKKIFHHFLCLISLGNYFSLFIYRA